MGQWSGGERPRRRGRSARRRPVPPRRPARARGGLGWGWRRRLGGCLFDGSGFTNLTRAPLDFHGTMERYLEAKGILFEMLEEASAKRFAKAAVLNAHDAARAHLRRRR